MEFTKDLREPEDRFPRAKDVLERETVDNGFSKGWSMHSKPVPEYYFDCHVHYKGDGSLTFAEQLRQSMGRAEALDVKRALIIMQIYDKATDFTPNFDSIMDDFPWLEKEQALRIIENERDKRLYWSLYMSYRYPDPALIDAAAKSGVCCVKLHNAALIANNVSPDLWLTDQWGRVFDAIERNRLPVLFHVTQRLTGSAYTYGGRNSYWSEGWKNGTSFTNEDLLHVFLECLRRNPGINFIGAHQLHIGWDRLEELFAEYPNLYVDTTVGCMLRLYDDFYDHDREYLRGIFVKWADRIIFGTDTFWEKDGETFDQVAYLRHIRFITQLELPEEALDKICHGNLERLCGLKSI